MSKRREELSKTLPTPSQPPAEIPEGEILEALKASQLADPLSEVTRSERKSLLAVGLLSLAITVGELIPTDIEAVGVKIEAAEQAGLLLILALTLAYFLTAFLFYGLADLNDWRLRIRLYSKRLRAIIAPLRLDKAQFQEASSQDWDRLARLGALKEETDLAKELMLGSKARVIFEFGVPLAFGLFALLIVLNSYAERASLGPWRAVLSIPWSIVPVVSACIVLAILLWRRNWNKKAPTRQVRKTSERLARLTDKMRHAGKLNVDDPARKAIMAEIDRELKSLAGRNTDNTT